jgi:MFS family permease
MQREQTSPHEGAPMRLSMREQLRLSFLWFALNFHSAALLPIVIPAQILLFVAPGATGNARQALFLGGLAALGAITMLIVQPLVGALSDRTSTRLGRRRPYILTGALLLLGGLAMLAVMREMTFFIVGLFLAVLGSTTSSAAYQGLVPDRVPAEQRGAASGYMGLMTILGTVGSLAVAALLLSHASEAGHSLAQGIARGASLFYALTGGVLVVGVGVTVAGVREAPFLCAGAHRPHMRDAAGVFKRCRQRLARLWIEPWRHHNFTWVFLTRGFVMLGLALFMTFIEYYFARVQHMTNFIEATAFNAVMALLGAICSTLVLGLISDRTRRVPVVAISTAFMALTALAFVIAPRSMPLWPLGLVFGLGYGAYTSVDWALAMDALPSLNAAGKDLGLWSMASTLPAVLAPLVGSAIISVADHFDSTALGYRLVFGLAALFLVLGAVFVLKVREKQQAVQGIGALRRLWLRVWPGGGPGRLSTHGTP